MLEITALTKEHKMPMPVYTRIYSSTENGFISEDEEVLNGLKHLTKHFGKTGIRTLIGDMTLMLTTNILRNNRNL